MQAHACNGADTLLNSLAEDRDATTTSMSRIARRTAAAAELSELRVETPADLLALANAHAKIHRLDASSAGEATTVAIQINVG